MKPAACLWFCCFVCLLLAACVWKLLWKLEVSEVGKKQIAKWAVGRSCFAFRFRMNRSSRRAPAYSSAISLLAGLWARKPLFLSLFRCIAGAMTASHLYCSIRFTFGCCGGYFNTQRPPVGQQQANIMTAIINAAAGPASNHLKRKKKMGAGTCICERAGLLSQPRIRKSGEDKKLEDEQTFPSKLVLTVTGARFQLLVLTFVAHL